MGLPVGYNRVRGCIKAEGVGACFVAWATKCRELRGTPGPFLGTRYEPPVRVHKEIDRPRGWQYSTRRGASCLTVQAGSIIHGISVDNGIGG